MLPILTFLIDAKKLVNNNHGSNANNKFHHKLRLLHKTDRNKVGSQGEVSSLNEHDNHGGLLHDKTKSKDKFVSDRGWIRRT